MLTSNEFLQYRGLKNNYENVINFNNPIEKTRCLTSGHQNVLNCG